MSIVTKTGDDGTTALMSNRRVSKCDARVEAYGAVDELDAALGLARATTGDTSMREKLLAIQKNLVAVMGELATAPEDLPRYTKDGFQLLNSRSTTELERWIKEIEPTISLKGWAMPGENVFSAA